jgi:3alpha(or 20beta)-hydroxysteroid dehydrogenase
MARLDGKVALITGGARGQGAAEARLFAAEGAKVVVTDVLDDVGKATAREVGGLYLHHDVTHESNWETVVAETLQQYGTLDVLVNNAGIGRMGNLETTPLDDYMAVIRVNQVGVYLGMKAVAEAMKGQRSGSIVNISSIAGMNGFNKRNSIAYTASKWAVRGMTKAAAQELAQFGIRVNSVHPGYIDTPMLRGGRDEVDEDMAARVTRRIPLRRIAEAEEVGRLVLFLASDESSYCTGGEFVVDGGVTA